MSDTKTKVDVVRTLDELASALGRSRPTTKRWSCDGMPRRPEGWSVSEVRAWAESRGLIAPDSEADERRAKLQAETEHRQALARLTDLRARHLAGQLHDTKTVRAMLSSVADTLLAQTDRLLGYLRPSDRDDARRECHAAVDAAVSRVLDSLPTIEAEESKES